MIATITVEDYLSKEEIKNIVEEEIREKIKDESIKNILYLIGYNCFYALLDERIPDFKKNIEQKVVDIIEKMSSYEIFYPSYVYGNDKKLGTKYLEESIENNKELLNNKVVKILNDLQETYIAEEITQIIQDKIESLFCKKEKGSEENEVCNT